MSATIFDVAKRAGVSIGTVSRVLNNRDRVHPRTRERVQKAIEELDFHSNALARGLASQQTDTLGLIIPQVNDPFYFQIVRGVEDAASKQGYSLLIASQPRTAAEPRYNRLFRRGHVDAMVLMGIDARPHEIQQIVERGVPIVFIQQEIDKEIPIFTADNYSGALAISRHLVEHHGYQKIAFISGTHHTPDSRERLRGLRDVLREHGLELPAHYIVQGDYLIGSGYTAMMQLLNLPACPDAVFAANDQMALDAIKAARDFGLKVPDDIAIVGFDDVPLASYSSPELTTVHQPIYELGYQAAQMALNGIRGDQRQRGGVAPRVLLPTTLVIRASCGCSLLSRQHPDQQLDQDHPPRFT
jgi:DNA-binding LacI/PurR family transcriptional regulator